MANNSIRTVLPIDNNEEKVEEIHRLLNILSKRKRCSILVSMLIVFQKYNFQKLLKEFLVEGVQQIILENPFKVVSFSGIPFTIKNCFMGMRVIIGKHRIFQKELIEGYEYLNVNLVYTCIFLSDEISKISKGSKNTKPVHSSLLDELDIVDNVTNNSQTGLNTEIVNYINLNNKNKTIHNNFLHEKRKRTYTNVEKEEEQIEYSGNLRFNKKGKSVGKKLIKHNNKIYNNLNDKQMKAKVEIIDDEKCQKVMKYNEKIINDSEDSYQNINFNNYSKIKGDNLTKTHIKLNNNKNNNIIEENKLLANIFYPKDINYFKCCLQDYLTVWNFDKSSPVNVYLKDNYQNISKIKNIFCLMQNIGANGQKFLKKLLKYIPELNNAASLSNEEKQKINGNEDLKESKEILDKINSINLVYKEYENKKKKLINIYQRMKSTVENIKNSINSEGKLFLKEDIEYLDMINKRFEQIIIEIIPLFNQLCDYLKKCLLKNVSLNLQNVSRILKENDLTLKSFSIFTQNLIGLFPHEPNNINTVNDLILIESMSLKEREKKFREIISKDKEDLLNSIKEYKINNKKNRLKAEKEFV